MFRAAAAGRCCLPAVLLIGWACWMGSLDAGAEESSPRARTMFAEAASYQNNSQYDLAAEEWEKFLESFPQDPLALKARYYAGVCRQQLKEFEPAVQHFQAVLTKDKDFELAEDAYLNLGWSLYSIGLTGQRAAHAKAEAVFQKLLKDFPQGKYLDQAVFYLGEARYSQGKTAEAIRAYQRFMTGFKQSALRCDALYALGVAHEELEEYPSAGRVYDQFLASCPDSQLSTEVRMRKAETVLQAGQLAEAAGMFAAVAAVRGFPEADHAWYRRAYCVSKQGQHAEAGKLYGELAQRFPESAYRDDAGLAAGRSYYRAQQFADAATWFAAAVDAGGDHALEAAHWLCRIHLQRGKPQRALAVAERVLSQDGQGEYLPRVQLDRADALYELPDRQGDAVAAYLQIARRLKPDHPVAAQAQYNAAFGALELKQFQDATGYATEFLERYPRDRLLPDVKYVAAESYLQLERYEQAAQTFSDLVDQYPEHPESGKWRLRHGRTLHLDQRYDEAVQSLRAAMRQLTPPAERAEAHYLIGLSRFRQSRYDAALEALEASLADDPKWRQADESLLYQSRAYRRLDRLDQAQASVSRLIKEFPQSQLLDQAYFRLGEYRYAAGRYEQSAAAYGTVIARWPSSIYLPYALHGRGWSQLKGGKFAEGARSFAQLVRAHPAHELAMDARFARAMCLRQSDQVPKALSQLAEYLQLELSPEQRLDALYERGLCYAAQQDFDRAAGQFQELLTAGPAYKNRANVLYELGWACKHSDQSDRALAAFRELAQHHPDHRLAAEACFHVAEQYYDQRQFEQAIPLYRRAAERTEPASDLSEQARHKLAWSHYGLQQYQQAAAQFAKQIGQYPQGKLWRDAQFMQAECFFKLKEFQRAWPLFVAAREAMPDAPRMQVLVLLHGGQCAAQLEQWQDSLQLLTRIPEQFPDTPQLATALYERGWAHQNLRQLDEAVRDYEQAAALSRDKVGARARFMIGEVQFDRREYDKAINSFRRVMYGFGGAEANVEVKHWQAMAGYEAGRCAEVQIKNANSRDQRAEALEQAKGFFRFVVEKHGQHRLAEKSRQRLTELSKLASR